ncbi:DUF6434 domain-containing protein [Ahrensia kielensis]|uniref:DUF6434 domain-containing protein n=1 Tax=Ahrensia kielensis TaxID=76980 RepID=A0ABU9T2I8_9HYPH|nr:DUF6434 domain-containing protein [Ahrensia kielensis]
MTKKFDWHSDEIMLNSVINDTYKNTQNVRRFFKAHIGEHFKFDRSFMAWMIDNHGATMGDAINEWQRRNSEK